MNYTGCFSCSLVILSLVIFLVNLMGALLLSCQALEHEEFVRVRTVHLNGKPRVLTLKQDLHYWKTWELRFDPETAMWRRKIIKALDAGVI